MSKKQLTLRDQFAMAALQSGLSEAQVILDELDGEKYICGWKNHKDLAETCYAIADAMMEARDETTT